MKRLFYPGVFIPEEDGGFSVFFPDLPGCITCGNSLDHACEMAMEAIGLILTYMEEKNEPFPSGSSPFDIVLEEGQFMVVVPFDIITYKNKIQAEIESAAFTDFNVLYHEPDFLVPSERAEIEFNVALIVKLIEAREKGSLSQIQLEALSVDYLDNLFSIPEIHNLYKILDSLDYTLAIVPKDAATKL